jgi:hypothetical protein
MHSFTRAPVTVGDWVGLDVGDCVGVVAVHVLAQATTTATASAMRLTILCGDLILGDMMSGNVSHRPIVAFITSPESDVTHSLRNQTLGAVQTPRAPLQVHEREVLLSMGLRRCAVARLWSGHV